MTNLTYNNQVISQREDNYVNATEMCQANDKRIHDWTRLASTKSYIEALPPKRRSALRRY